MHFGCPVIKRKIYFNTWINISFFLFKEQNAGVEITHTRSVARYFLPNVFTFTKSIFKECSSISEMKNTTPTVYHSLMRTARAAKFPPPLFLLLSENKPAQLLTKKLLTSSHLIRNSKKEAAEVILCHRQRRPRISCLHQVEGKKVEGIHSM